MSKPQRIRLSRAKGFDLQAHSKSINGLEAVNVARPSKWGNPFEVGKYGTRFPLWMLWAKGEDFGLMRKMFDRVFTRAADLLDHTERIAEDQRVFDPA